MHLPKHLIHYAPWQHARTTRELKQFVAELHQHVESIDLEVMF